MGCGPNENPSRKRPAGASEECAGRMEDNGISTDPIYPVILNCLHGNLNPFILLDGHVYWLSSGRWACDFSIEEY